MDKSVLIKLIGFLVVTFIIMVVASFFLFPYLSSDTYKEIVEDHEKKQFASWDSTFVPDSLSQEVLSADSLQSEALDSITTITKSELSILKIEKVKLQTRLDSLSSAHYQLKKELEEKSKKIRDYESNLAPEEFSNRVKSLLNLEVEELAPILQKMTNTQLVKMYMNGGNTQREKILRALDADKAAQIISEVML